MIFWLRFLTPLVSPIIPRKATELPSSCVELIAFIDLMGPPGHFSKIVIENAAWQVSRSDRLEWVCEDGVGRRGKLAPYACGVQWMLAFRSQTWDRLNTWGHKTGVSFWLQTGLREGLRLRRGRRIPWQNDAAHHESSKFKSNHGGLLWWPTG